MPLPAAVALEFYQGDEVLFVLRLRASDALPPVYRDLSGKQVKAQIRAKPGAPAVLAEFTADVLDQGEADTIGAIRLFISADDMGSVPATGLDPLTGDRAHHSWDLQLQNTDGSGRQTVAAGPVYITAEVTL